MFQEHMILCRFADQTAVQLPPERRLIGTVQPFTGYYNVTFSLFLC